MKMKLSRIGRNIIALRNAALFIVVTLSLVSYGNGHYTPRLLLYTELEGTTAIPDINIEQNEPDLSRFEQLPLIENFCNVGVWDIFEHVNYRGHLRTLEGWKPNSTDDPGERYCGEMNFSRVLSVRHRGAKLMYIDAISFYPEDFHGGDEDIFIELMMRDIKFPVRSVAISGPSDWTIFDKSNLEGRSFCLRISEMEQAYPHEGNVENIFPGGTVRSVIRGCDKEEQKIYRNTGFKQQLWLFTSTDQEYLIDKDVSDLSQPPYDSINMKAIRRYCSKGVWDLYLEPKMTILSYHARLGAGNEYDFHCGQVDMSNVKSVRHVGSLITSEDVLYLYPNSSQQTNLHISNLPSQSKEILTIQRNYTSIALTGSTTQWTLFDDGYLNGNSICLSAPGKEGNYILLEEVENILPGGQIRSAFLGCDPIELDLFIKMYFGFRQKLKLEQNLPTYEYFNTLMNIPDLQKTTFNFTRIQKVCARGVWQLFEEVDFKGHSVTVGDPMNGKSEICEQLKHPVIPKSLRHWGPLNPGIEALSLYRGERQSGEEILITSQAYYPIKMPVRSFVATGATSWTLFEGSRLDGKSNCFPSRRFSNFAFGEKEEYHLSSVGSVFKTCNRKQVQAYKKKHNVY